MPSEIEIVAAVIERADRRMLIGQRRHDDTSPLKWEFPGGTVEPGETPEAGLARELREELGVDMVRSVAIFHVDHDYGSGGGSLSIRFFAVAIKETELHPVSFAQIAWVLPRELGSYDFLAANRPLIAQLATGRIRPAEILAAAFPGAFNGPLAD